MPYARLTWMAADAIACSCGLWRYTEGILPTHLVEDLSYLYND